jgi:hypothetical protein
MTIKISESDFYAEIEATAQVDPLDRLSTICNYPPSIGQGSNRWIELREGLELGILQLRLADRSLPAFDNGYDR